MTDFDYELYQLHLAEKRDDSAENEHRNVKCPKCDTVQSATHKKCSNCGHDLTKARKGKFANMSQDFDPTEYEYQLALARDVEAIAGSEWGLQLAKDSLAKASTPEPFSTSKTSNWVAKVGGLPDYIQHIAHGILRSGRGITESRAIQMAIGVCKRWAAGIGKVDKNTRAAAAKAIAEWEAKKAASHAKSAAKAA